jgi:hypothetical protein
MRIEAGNVQRNRAAQRKPNQVGTSSREVQADRFRNPPGSVIEIEGRNAAALTVLGQVGRQAVKIRQVFHYRLPHARAEPAAMEENNRRLSR